MKASIIGPAVALLTLTAPLLAAAQAPAAPQAVARPQRPSAATYVKPTVWPKEDRAAVAQALSQARRNAGADLFSDMAHRCIISPNHGTRVRGIQHDGYLEPARLFDNLYSVGQNSVSAFALTTSDGIVLFDALNNEDEARTLIVPNLIKMGLDPAKMKYIIVTHGHGDHYGGAQYLADTFGARVVSSAIDWDVMDALRGRTGGPFAPPPKRDMEVADGQSLTVGDTVMTFYITPGHTPGTVSTIFKVREGAQTHTVGFHGGTGGAAGRADELKAHIASLQRWRPIAARAGVDVLIANHPLHDRGIENNEILRYRLTGDPNPYVVGAERYQRYMMVQEDCARVGLARLGVAP
jgi:metallo-beta-lactamase class B